MRRVSGSSSPSAAAHSFRPGRLTGTDCVHRAQRQRHPDEAGRRPRALRGECRRHRPAPVDAMVSGSRRPSRLVARSASCKPVRAPVVRRSDSPWAVSAGFQRRSRTTGSPRLARGILNTRPPQSIVSSDAEPGAASAPVSGGGWSVPPEWPGLDRPHLGDRVPGRDLDGLLQTTALEDVESADRLLALCTPTLKGHF